MNKNIQEGAVLTTIQNNIGTITFSHPASNSLTSNMLLEITNQILLFEKNSKVVVIVIKSTGDSAFCAGASLTELKAICNFDQGKAFFMGFANLINTMRKCSKMIVGRIHSKAVGGGVGLIAACDYAVATQNAAIKLSEIAIGIGPFVIEPAVTRKIGIAAVGELALDANTWKSASWSQQKGLFVNLFETEIQLDTEVEMLTNRLAAYNPEAMAALKKVLWKNTKNWDKLLPKRAEISGNLVLSDYTKKALANLK